MSKRLRRIGNLVKMDRRCRMLVWTGAKPQGTWGHQGAGLAPSAVAGIRRDFVKAAMVRKQGGCTTTALALSVGYKKDLAIALRQEVVTTWMEVLAKTELSAAAVGKTWATKLQDQRGQQMG